MSSQPKRKRRERSTSRLESVTQQTGLTRRKDSLFVWPASKKMESVEGDGLWAVCSWRLLVTVRPHLLVALEPNLRAARRRRRDSQQERRHLVTVIPSQAASL